MKKTIAILFSLIMLSSMSACSNNSGISDNSSFSVQEQTTESVISPDPVRLTNKMSENELNWVNKHSLTLLDEPVKLNADPQAEHKVSIEFFDVDTASWRKNIEENRDQLTDGEYNQAMKHISEAEETGVAYRTPGFVLVDGYFVNFLIPYEDDFADGIPFSFTTVVDYEDGEPVLGKLSFYTFEEYLEYVREENTKWGYTDEENELITMYVQIAYDALRNGDYETLHKGSVDTSDRSHSLDSVFKNYRSNWEFDRDAVEAIKDSVDEISIFDDELGKEFVVHVTLPPDYDKDKTYPVFFLTDGIWRFGNCPELRKCMENGEAAPVILVSLYYSYEINDPDQEMRYYDLVINREQLLDFITDNLMPYLCETYNIDCSNSTLYGHSDGGVFAHYALFNSDKYENQPFGHYIIGSPAFWGLYHDNQYLGISNDNVLKDYDYFDRNEALNKTVFLCAGSLEDPDYAANYREGDDTTLEGVAKLKERLESHSADLKYRMYESHHYQYIPEMLIEYLKETYPC